jgi:hypothetical protein
VGNYHLRREGEVRRLWIDAICINQTDLDERNYQVSRMDRIYYRVRRVAIWLGRESKDSSKALEYMMEIESDRNEHEDYFEPAAMEELPKGWCLGNWFLNQDEEWDAILVLCATVYWTRLWIVQVMLATKATLYCGSVEIDRETFRHFWKEVRSDAHRRILDSIPAKLVRQKDQDIQLEPKFGQH